MLSYADFAFWTGTCFCSKILCKENNMNNNMQLNVSWKDVKFAVWRPGSWKSRLFHVFSVMRVKVAWKGQFYASQGCSLSYSRQVETFYKNLSATLRIGRNVCFKFLFNYNDHVSCFFHNFHVFLLLQKFLLRKKCCIILEDTKENCWHMMIQQDNISSEHEFIVDAFACIYFFKSTNAVGCSIDERYGHQHRRVREKPICTRHIWRLSSGRQKANNLIRPAAEHGIWTLGTLIERQMLLWARRYIFRNDVLVLVYVIFESKLYNYYVKNQILKNMF